MMELVTALNRATNKRSLTWEAQPGATQGTLCAPVMNGGGKVVGSFTITPPSTQDTLHQVRYFGAVHGSDDARVLYKMIVLLERTIDEWRSVPAQVAGE